MTLPPPRLLLRGVLAGLVAALVMTIAMVLLRLFAGVGLPAELVGDRFLPLLPVDTFLDLLRLLGGPIRAKELALYTGLPGQIAVGALTGALFVVVCERGVSGGPSVRRAWLAAACLAGGVWVVTVAVLWPALDSSYVGLPPGPAVWASVLGLLLAYAAYGATLAATYLFLRADAS